jgi:hypothetical protein
MTTDPLSNPPPDHPHDMQPLDAPVKNRRLPAPDAYASESLYPDFANHERRGGTLRDEATASFTAEEEVNEVLRGVPYFLHTGGKPLRIRVPSHPPTGDRGADRLPSLRHAFDRFTTEFRAALEYGQANNLIYGPLLVAEDRFHDLIEAFDYAEEPLSDRAVGDRLADDLRRLGVVTHRSEYVTEAAEIAILHGAYRPKRKSGNLRMTAEDILAYIDSNRGAYLDDIAERLARNPARDWTDAEKHAAKATVVGHINTMRRDGIACIVIRYDREGRKRLYFPSDLSRLPVKTSRFPPPPIPLSDMFKPFIEHIHWLALKLRHAMENPVIDGSTIIDRARSILHGLADIAASIEPLPPPPPLVDAPGHEPGDPDKLLRIPKKWRIDLDGNRVEVKNGEMRYVDQNYEDETIYYRR